MQDQVSAIKAKLYKTAQTRAVIGKIPAGVFVAVAYDYTDCLGRHVFSINTALDAESDVLYHQLTNFCL